MEIGLEILCNFVDKMLEGELSDEELCQFLVVVDLCLVSLGETSSGWLEMEISLEILCNFVDKMLEGELSDEELRQFLVVVDFM